MLDCAAKTMDGAERDDWIVRFLIWIVESKEGLLKFKRDLEERNWERVRVKFSFL